MQDETKFSHLTEEFIKVNNLLTQIQKKPIKISNNIKLSTSMIHLLELINKYPNATITELSIRLGVTKGAISQQINTLKKLKFINISQRKNNKKNKLISLTTVGKGILNSHDSLHKELYDSIQGKLSTFTNEQLQIIQDILGEISYSIKEYQTKLSEGKY